MCITQTLEDLLAPAGSAGDKLRLVDDGVTPCVCADVTELRVSEPGSVAIILRTAQERSRRLHKGTGSPSAAHLVMQATLAFLDTDGFQKVKPNILSHAAVFVCVCAWVWFGVKYVC